jgi:hypothetical protein
VIAHHALKWIGLVILFSAAAISQNPELVSITLGVIANYLTDWFRNVPKKDGAAKLKMVQGTKDGSYRIFDYDGPVESLVPIRDTMDNFYDER